MTPKKLLYYSDSRFPLAAVAAAMHTGMLPDKDQPAREDLQKLLFLDGAGKWDGKILFLGSDETGEKIYAFWLKGESGWSHRLIKSFIEIYQPPDNEFRLVDIPFKDNSILTAAHYFCRLPVLEAPGLYLSKLGLRKLYAPLRELVRGIKARQPNLP